MKNIDKILEIISSCDCGYTVKDIMDKLNWKINKTTVYRNIEKLQISWIIIENYSSNWEKIYSKKENHHHHFICNICNNNINIWCFVDKEIIKLEDKFWFKVNNHSLTLSWICNECK